MLLIDFLIFLREREVSLLFHLVMHFIHVLLPVCAPTGDPETLVFQDDSNRLSYLARVGTEGF